MPLYRVTRRYSDGRILLSKGRVVEFDQDEADRLNRDSAGLLDPLTADEAAQLAAELAAVAERTGITVRPDWTPPADHTDTTRGRGPGDGPMHSANMPGLSRPR